MFEQDVQAAHEVLEQPMGEGMAGEEKQVAQMDAFDFGRFAEPGAGQGGIVELEPFALSRHIKEQGCAAVARQQLAQPLAIRLRFA